MTHVDPSKLCQIELAVSNVEAAISFYHNVFGWKLTDAKMHDYYILDVPQNCNFGIALVPKSSTSIKNSGITLYFNTNLRVQIEKLALSNGGHVSNRPAIPGYKKITFIEDPDGNNFGLID